MQPLVLVEWAVKTAVSIPAVSNVNFSHLAIVLEVATWLGLMNDRKSFPSDPLKDLVHSS